jgi:hypothetical protein
MVTECESSRGIFASMSLQLSLPDGTPLTLAVAEMDIHDHNLPMTRKMREKGAISYGVRRQNI